MLDARTYPDKSVIRFAEQVVPLKIEITKQPKIVGQYGIEGTPTIMFLEPDGKAIGSFVGFHPPKEFMAESIKVLKKRKSK